MFKLDYIIVHTEYDDFFGQNGFFQFKCNDYIYGDMYPKELEEVMDKVSLYNWFERMNRTIKNLETKKYVALSDVESYNTWIEFRRKGRELVISLIKAEKKQNSSDIEFAIDESTAGEWVNQVVDYSQFRQEIIEKTGEYIKYIVSNDSVKLDIDKIKRDFDVSIMKYNEV